MCDDDERMTKEIMELELNFAKTKYSDDVEIIIGKMRRMQTESESRFMGLASLEEYEEIKYFSGYMMVVYLYEELKKIELKEEDYHLGDCEDEKEKFFETMNSVPYFMRGKFTPL